MFKKRSPLNLVLSILAVLVVSYFLHGIPILGLPKVENIESVEITDTKYGNEAKKITSAEDIKTARNLAGGLRYKFKAINKSEPYIYMVFYTKDGKTAKLFVGEKIAEWNNKNYTIVDTDFFINAVEGLYFTDEQSKIKK